MSLSLTIVETRPNITTPFYEMSHPYLAYIQKYNNSGQRTGTKGIYDYTNNALTRTGVIKFATQQDHDLIQADPVVVEEFNRWSAYNTTNSITMTQTLA